ncbi:MAG TPA: hypothetical protein VF471_07815 [Pseudoxanthomonas sp.]
MTAVSDLQRLAQAWWDAIKEFLKTTPQDTCSRRMAEGNLVA